MKFFKFLKKDAPPEHMEFEDIPLWLDSFIKKKNLENRVERFQDEFQEIMEELLSLTEELEEADLMNPNIPERAKHAMEGNRKNFSQRMKRFIGDIELPDDYRELGDFSSRISESITIFGEDTARNFTVLNEFFGHEMKKIASRMKRLQDAATRFEQEIRMENLDSTEKIRYELEELNKESERIASLESERDQIRKDLESLKEKEKKIKKTIQDIKSGDEYGKLDAMTEKIEKKQKEIENLRRDLLSDFSTLERSLKKYTYNTPDEKVAQNYLENAAKGLYNDPELKISTIIKEMKGKLPELGLKDSKKANTREMCEKLTKEYLRDKRDELRRLEDEIDSLSDKVKNDPAARKLAKQEDLLERNQNKIKQKTERIKDIEEQKESIDIPLMKQRIKDKIKEFANVKFENKDEIKN